MSADNKFPETCQYDDCKTPAMHRIKRYRKYRYYCTKHMLLFDKKIDITKIQPMLQVDKDRIESDLFFDNIPFGDVLKDRALSFSEKVDKLY